MREFLIILFVIAILLALTAFRYRRQIKTGLYVWRMFKQMRQAGKPQKKEKQIENTNNSTDVQLVRCAKCGSWLPQNTALKLSKNTFYCSSKCMENAVKV